MAKLGYNTNLNINIGVVKRNEINLSSKFSNYKKSFTLDANI